MDCLDISKEFKTFFNKVFAVAGNILENRAVSRAPFNRVILEETLSTVLKLKANTVLIIPKKTVSEVANALEIVEKLGLRVDWIEKVL